MPQVYNVATGQGCQPSIVAAGDAALLMLMLSTYRRVLYTMARELPKAVAITYGTAVGTMYKEGLPGDFGIEPG